MKKAISTLIFQIIASIAQYANLASGFVPAKLQIWSALVIGIAQALQAWRAHWYNPDGTRATSAYNPN